MKVQAVYRISDNSYKKGKLPGATKECCLRNFLECFPDWPVKIILDRCQTLTTNMVANVAKNRATFLQTKLSNAGSLMCAIDILMQYPEYYRRRTRAPERAYRPQKVEPWFPGFAINQHHSNPPDAAYFVEDDYLHDPSKNCQQLILEGLEKADYVTLYDHPDKYEIEYDFGETTKVFKTNHAHWKYTVSTTMTFAARLEALRRDHEIWEKYTKESHPHDHLIFTEIGSNKLASCLPGASCHTDLAYSEEQGKFLIDEFAVNLVEDKMQAVIRQSASPEVWSKITLPDDPLKRLIVLSGLAKKCCEKKL